MTRAWLLLLTLYACGGEDAPAPVPAATAAGTDVVELALERLDSELASEDAPLPDGPVDLPEQVAGLLETVASARDSLRGLAAEELVGLGPAAVPALAASLDDRGRDDDVRVAAVTALAAIGTPQALEPLLLVLEGSRIAVERESWLYRACARELTRVRADWVAPRLTVCLKYEIDPLTVVHLADALAGLGLDCGLEALFVVARESSDATARAQAEDVLERLRDARGCADWSELSRNWNDGVVERLPPPPSGARYEREVWRAVAALGSWQLRPVDEARFMLQRQRETAAAILAQALGDGDVYVRLHTAQSLARMGPRGRVAEGALIAALDDAQVGATAAEALGRLGGAAAARALAERLVPAHGLELRVACARALGALAPLDLEATLAPWLAEVAPLELATAAAEALLRSGRVVGNSPSESAALRRALAGLTSGLVEPSTCEAALEAWIAAQPESAELLAQWRALSERPNPERLAERAAWIEALPAFAQSR